MSIRRITCLIVAAVVAGLMPFPAPEVQAQGTLERIGEFRPFPRHNPIRSVSTFSAVDPARRHWFLFGSFDPANGAIGNVHVTLFHLDRMAQVGHVLRMPAAHTAAIAYAFDHKRGVLFFVYGTGAGQRVAAVKATAGGPAVVAEWDPTAHLAAQRGPDRLDIMAMSLKDDHLYLGAETPPFPSPNASEGVAVVRARVDGILAGESPFEWRYNMRQCAGLPHYSLPTVLGPSRYGNYLLVPCRATLVLVFPPPNELQGVTVVDMGSSPNAPPAEFTERFHPIAGDYSFAESYYDPVSDRIAMRRVNPAQLVVFDGRNRVFLQPILLGRDNIFQSAFDPATGRVYGEGNVPAAGSASAEALFASELRTTPPQNGAQIDFQTPGLTAQGGGALAVDSATGRIFVADYDERVDENGFAHSDGLFFHIYRDTRPPLPEREVIDADAAVVNYSGEAQGYGGRVSYVGGAGSAFSFATTGVQYPAGDVVAAGTRHFVFAHTERLRLSDAESSGSAITGNEEASFAEANRQGAWPYKRAECRDFAAQEVRAESHGSVVECNLSGATAKSASTYKAPTEDSFAAPIQQAHTESTIRIDRTRGVVVTVFSHGSLDIPGLLHIGRAWARAETSAAGASGKATGTYERGIENVRIGTQQVCDTDCDPKQVAEQINRAFANLGPSAGIMVVADAPDPDPGLRQSKGGAQAIVQRDYWQREQDLGVHDSGESHFENPAFVVTIYQDRKFPQHEVYQLAGVQAASRLPRSLADRIDEFDSTDPDAGRPPSVGGIDPGDFGLVGLGGGIGDNGGIGLPGTEGAVKRRPRVSEVERQLAWTFRSPLRSPGILALLAFLASPVFLASRRRILLVYRPPVAGER